MVRRRLQISLWIALLLAWGATATVAQVQPDSTQAEETVEAALEDIENTTGDPTQLAEILADLETNPLDINAAPADELALIPAFGPLLGHQIVAFRETFGLFESIPELRAVEGVTDDVFLAARPYLTIGPTFDVTPSDVARAPSSLRQAFSNLTYEVIQRVGRRLDVGRGYDDDTTRTTYAGSPDRLYTRLRIRSRRQLSLNLTLDKDPGERFAWEPDNQSFGYDYVSAHASLNNVGRLQTLVIGDYVMNFGQGLVFSRASAFGKGREPVRPLVRTSRGVVPYSSTDENNFMRGLATSVRVAGNLLATAFASRRTLDAGLIEPDTTMGGAFEDLTEASSLAISGLHRTPNEIGKKDAVREDLVGGAVAYRFPRAEVGVVGYHSRFDRPFSPGTRAYQRFLFSGDRTTMIGAFGNLYLGDMLVFGEVARSQDDVLGGIGGVSMRFAKIAEAVVLARHYPRNFVSLHGFAFGERNGATQNETGYYLGLQLRPSKTWRVMGYVDQYRFPWVRFNVPRPSNGYDALLAIEHKPRPWFLYYLQARTEMKEAGADILSGAGRLLDGVRPETRQSLRLHGDYSFSRRLRLRARVEGIRFATPDDSDEYGFVIYQDIRWLPVRSIQLDTRLAFFNTDSFDARVFTYENDLLYTFSVPAFSGRGQRAYVLLRWQPTSQLTFQAKASITRFEDRDTVGSGLDEVEGNQLREIRAQVRWRF